MLHLSQQITNDKTRKQGKRKRTMGVGVLCQYSDPYDTLSYLLQRIYPHSDCDRAMVTISIRLLSFHGSFVIYGT